MASQSAPQSDTTTAPSDQNSSDNLWAEALDLLDADDSERLRLLTAERITVLDEVLVAAKDKQKQSQDKQWKYKKSDGTNSELRDVFDKMVKWLTKLQTLGDYGVQFDPTHLSVPWAAIKFFLTIASIDSLNLSAVFDGLEMTTNLINRYKIFEELYLREVSKASNLLKQAITKLYASVLTFLAQAKRYYSQNTAKRMAKSALQIADLDVKKMMEDIRSQQTAADEFARLIDAESLRQVNDKLEHLALESGKELRKVLNDEVHGHLSTLLQHTESLKHKEFRNWISPIPYSKHHDNIRKDRIQESGLWIFEQKEYVEWKQSTTSSLLWLRGMPGSGKSRLM
ncbi:hypothetical protein BJ166DRAFT_280797 [Pestalotiopsis sp. NC0098]|nr:hypothetical protein BJ166DRAFT_280797 [Pestalotiopsis sp. NC0098]